MRIRIRRAIWEGIVLRVLSIPPLISRLELLKAILQGGIHLRKLTSAESEHIQLEVQKEVDQKKTNFVSFLLSGWMILFIHERIVKDDEVLNGYGHAWKDDIERKSANSSTIPIPVAERLRWLAYGLSEMGSGECGNCVEKEKELLEKEKELSETLLENGKLKEENEELKREKEEVMQELKELREELEKYKNLYEKLENKVQEVEEEIVIVKKERNELRKEVEKNQKNESRLNELGECNDRLEKLKDMRSFLSLVPCSTRDRISDLKKGYTRRQRLNVIRCAASLMGDSLEDVGRCLAVLYKIEQSPKPTEVKSTICKLTTAETWEVCMRCDLSDAQLEALRSILKEKHQSLANLFGCSHAVGNLRRKHTTELSNLLNIQRTPNDDGVYCSISLAIEKILQLYPSKYAWGNVPTKRFLYKLSGDGKVDADRAQWMFGISPLSVSSVCVQSPYNVFPLALVCCEEKSEVLKEQLSSLFDECSILNEKGFLKRTDGKKHFFKLVIVADLKTCWQVFNFGGFSSNSNCPYCKVVNAKERANHHRHWKTWSRPKLVSFLGLTNEQFIFCTLHLVIRCVEFFLQNVYDKVVKTAEEAKLAYIMVHDIGVGWKLYEGGTKKKGLRVRSFTGTQYRKILANIELVARLIKVKADVSPDLGDEVWGEFREMLKVVEDGNIEKECLQTKGTRHKRCGWNWEQKREEHEDKQQKKKGKGKGKGEQEKEKEKEPEKICVKCYERKGRRWIEKFCTLHGADTMRVYFHLLMCHAAALVVKFGDLRSLSQQGFERANCEHNAFALRHSNHHYGKSRKRKSDGGLINDAILQVVVYFLLLFLFILFYFIGSYSKLDAT
jgi:hypothetical protein